MRKWAVPGFFVLVACARPPVVPEPSIPAPEVAQGDDIPYDRAVTKTTHNAYDRSEPLFDQLVWHHIRSIELDIHVEKSAAPDLARDWYVYHADLPALRDTSCTTFSSCLRQLAAFHAAVPQHEVVTLFVDLKDDFAPDHTPADLDAILERTLGRESIVTPADLAARCTGATTLRSAVTGACAFPTLAELRGKILVAVTGGSLCDDGSHTSQYGAKRLAFLAPDVDESCPVEAYDRRPEVVFFNMPFEERRRARAVRARGLVARVYAGGIVGGLDTPGDFAAALAAGAQLLATDRVNAEADPWSTSPTRSRKPEGLVTIDARSGDVGANADSFYWAYEDDPGAATWSAFVSVPSSHVEADAKACLMARASDAPDAADAALCRPFDQGPPRLYVRARDGGPTVAFAMATPDGVSAESPAFLRLALAPAASGTEVVAEGSADGKSWSAIGRAVTSSALRLRGLAVASRGRAPVHAVFGGVTRTKDAATSRYVAATFPAKKAIGAGASGELFDDASR